MSASKTRVVHYCGEYDRDTGAPAESAVERLIGSACAPTQYDVCRGFLWFNITPGQKARVLRRRVAEAIRATGSPFKWLNRGEAG